MDWMNQIAPNNQLYIISQSFHVGYLNQLAMDTCGITKETVVEAGEFTKDEDGELTGVAYEIGATNFIRSCLPKMTGIQVDQYLKKQLNDYSEAGYTTLGVAGVNFRLTDDRGQRLEALAHTGPVRIVAYFKVRNLHKLPGDVVPSTPDGSNYCLIGVKWWADGTPYAGAIGFKQPFLDTNITRAMNFPPPPNYGSLMYTYNDLHVSMMRYHQRGFQLATHTQGPRAVEQVLDVYENILRIHPKLDHRFRLEHNAFITDDQLARAKSLGVTVSFYADHVWYFGRALRDDIIGEMAHRVMPFGSTLAAGLEQTVHTDTPCTPLGPMRLFKIMATRSMWRHTTGTPDGLREEVLGPEQAIPVDEVIKAFTINSAKQLFHEDFIGSIEVGKYADFTRMSANPRKIDPFDLDTIDITATYRAGEPAPMF